MNEEEKIEVPTKKNKTKGIARYVTKKQVKDAIDEAHGVIQDVCKVLHMSSKTFYRRWRYDKEIEELLTLYRTSGFEEVTDVLYKKCLEGDIKAIHTYLKYNPMSKIQGWIDNQTIIIKDEKPLTDSEKDDLRKQLFG